MPILDHDACVSVSMAAHYTKYTQRYLQRGKAALVREAHLVCHGRLCGSGCNPRPVRRYASPKTHLAPELST